MGETIALPIAETDDLEITCLYCKRVPCAYGLTVRRRGETALVGLCALCKALVCPPAAPNACKAAEPWEWDGCCSRCNASLTWEGDDPECEDEAICDPCLRAEARERRRVKKSATDSSRKEERERCAWGACMNPPLTGVSFCVYHAAKGDTGTDNAADPGTDKPRAMAYLGSIDYQGQSATGVTDLVELLRSVRRETIEACEAAAKAGIPFRATDSQAAGALVELLSAVREAIRANEAVDRAQMRTSQERGERSQIRSFRMQKLAEAYETYAAAPKGCVER